MAFVIRKGTGVTLENDLFLIGTGKHKGHCHLTSSVKDLLNSETFRKHNSDIVEIFETAYTMMMNKRIGDV